LTNQNRLVDTYTLRDKSKAQVSTTKQKAVKDNLEQVEILNDKLDEKYLNPAD
jgi:hypothetical protein